MAKKEPFPGIADWMVQHIQKLGLSDKTSYKNWCKQNGFSTSLSKGGAALRREQALVRTSHADSLLKQKKRPRNALTTLQKILQGKGSKISYPSGQSYWAQIVEYQEDGAPRVFFELLEHILNLKVWKEKIAFGAEKFDIIQGIYKVCLYRQHWVRSYKDWEPRTHNARRQFASLVRHLFTKYPVPSFMNCVWFGNDHNYVNWFWHVGQGGNVRTLDPPVFMTKKVAHHFLEAPYNYSITNALSYSQIINLK
jgi:hypothetical protein